MSGLLYLAVALLAGAGFLYHALLLMNPERERQPMRTFVFSINYLMVLFGALLVDHYLPLLMG
jgi:protoheme IX farnesyltransferase